MSARSNRTQFLSTVALITLATSNFSVASPSDGHRLLIADIANNGVTQQPWSTGSASVFVPDDDHGMSQPNGIVVGPDCRVYVPSYNTDDIKVYLGDGTYDESIPLPTIGSTTYVQPCDVVFGPRDGLMYVSAINQQAVLAYDLETGVWSAPITSAEMATTLFAGGRPGYMTFLPSGDLLIGDYQDGEILEWNPSTATLSTLISGLNGPENLALGPDGDLFVVEYGNDRVLRYSRSSGYSVSIVFAPTSGETMTAPHGLAFSPDGLLLIGYRSDGTIHKYTAPISGAGTALGVFSSGHDPLALTFESRACFGSLERGEIVATYCPDTECGCIGGLCVCFGPHDDAAVVKIIDPDVVPFPALGENTLAPMFSNLEPLTANSWTFANLGPVFGTAIDRSPSPNIFVASSGVYGSFPMSGLVPSDYARLFKLDGVTHAITLLDTLPNTGCGLGDLAWNQTPQRLYVSNFEDGCIYTYTRLGLRKQKFDPFGLADAGDDGAIPLESGGRVWGLCVLDSKTLLFSVWLRDSGATATAWPAVWGAPGPIVNNALFAVKIAADGTLYGWPKLMRVMPRLFTYTNGGGNLDGYSNPVADMELRTKRTFPHVFTKFVDCGERTMYSAPDSAGYTLFAAGEHESRLVEVGLGSTALGALFHVGDFTTMGVAPWSHSNCCGGVALDLRRNIWTTGDALHQASAEDLLAGLQRISTNGNASANPATSRSMLIDLDQNTFIDPNVYTDDDIQSGDVECCLGGLSNGIPDYP